MRNGSDYFGMLNGIRPEGCTCYKTKNMSYGRYDRPEPAQWELDEECPRHGDE